ncbi:MAG TPA: NAD(P)H-dependent oxidoreductase [Holophaga sp.]|nr:NAD(P)H-dependent oxidoreductase [Holophaga sp.]
MASKRIGVLVGSLRQASFNRKMAKALAAIAPEGLTLEILEIGQLPFYNQDLDDAPPAAWTEFRKQVAACDGFLFITPEYNRSVPAVLKNALDVASRPYGQSAWDGRPGAVISLTPGALGAFGANHHLRQSLVFLNVPTMQQPEAYIGNAAALFAEDGSFANASIRGFAETFMQAFAAWVVRNAPPARA